MSKKALFLFSLAVLAAVAAGYVLLRPIGGKVAAQAASGYGQPIDAKKGQVLELAKIFADPAGYKGKNVIVEGRVSQVCQTSGCWLIMTDGANQLFVQFYAFTVNLRPGTKIRVQGEIGQQNGAPYLAGSGLAVIK